MLRSTTHSPGTAISTQQQRRRTQQLPFSAETYLTAHVTSRQHATRHWSDPCSSMLVSMVPTHKGQHQQARELPTESSQVLHRRLSQHQQHHCYDEPTELGHLSIPPPIYQSIHDVQSHQQPGRYPSPSYTDPYWSTHQGPRQQIFTTIHQRKCLQVLLLPLRNPTLEQPTRRSYVSPVPRGLPYKDGCAS